MLEFSVKQQTLHFFYYVLIGFSVGILFDAFRSVRVRYQTNRLLSHIMDVVFGLSCSGYLIAVFYRLDGLMLCIFNMIGAVLGLILYFLLFCRFFRALFQKILTIFIKIFKIVLYPVLLLCRIGIRIFRFFKKQFMRFGKRFLKWSGRFGTYTRKRLDTLRKKVRKN